MSNVRVGRYTRLLGDSEKPLSEEESRLVSDTDEALMPAVEAKRAFPRIDLALRLLSSFMFIAGLSMLLVTLDYKQSDRSCAAQLSIWSPLFEAVEYEQRDWESIFTKQHSEWTGAPTAELEARWHKLVNVPTVLIPEDRVPSLNRSIEQGFVRAGPAGDGYIAGVEVFHHLHCLNVLRQALWVDDYPPDLVPSLFRYNSPAVARKHADHCISTLHQALTCNADLTPYLLYDSTGTGAGAAREDFQATHKCKKFDQIVDWIAENGITISFESLVGKANHTHHNA